MKVTLLIFLCFLLGLAASAQTKKSPVIKFDIDAEEAATILPFDQRFRFESFETTYDSIYFKYEISPDEKQDWHYFNGGAFPLRIKKPAGLAIFPEAIKPLHPNVPYRFEFHAFKNIDLTPTEKTALKVETFELIKANFSKPADISEATIANFKSEITMLVKNYAKASSFYNEDGTAFTLNMPLFESYVYPTIDALETISLDINTREKNIASGVERVFETLSENSDAVTKIYKICNGNIRPSQKLKALLESKVDPLLTGYETTTMQGFGSYFFDDLNYNLDAVLRKNYRVEGATLVPNGELDKNSLLLLQSFFDKIVSKNVTNAQNNAIFKPEEIVQFQKIRDEISKILERLDEIETRKSKIESLSQAIPNILANAYIMDIITVEESIYMDLTAEKNAYIGLDLGVVYAFSLESIFIYEGTNIYFRPINREALFSDLQGWDEFFKRMSLYIGVAQLITDKPANFKPLFANSSLLAGIGWRVNRTFRLNVGGLMHYESNPDPLVTDQSFKVAPTVSFSADIDIIKAFGSIGKVLNITQ